MGFSDTILGDFREAPLTEAGKYLFDQTKGLYDSSELIPTQKVRFGGNTFEIIPKAARERVGLQLSILNAMKGLSGNQTLDHGLLAKLAPAIGMAAGSGLFKGTGGVLSDGWSALKDWYNSNYGAVQESGLPNYVADASMIADNTDKIDPSWFEGLDFG